MATLVPNNPVETQPQKANTADFRTPRPPKTLGVTSVAPSTDDMGPATPASTQQPAAQQPGIIAGAQTAQPAYNAERPAVDRATETTQGQLDSLLAGDSPVLQRARTIAAQQANSRGLLNSTMAAEAGTAAVIDRAVPIANADAGVYDQRARGNAAAGNESLSQGANIAAQMNLQREQQGSQASLQDSQQKFAAIQSRLDREQQTSLTRLQAQLQEALNTKSLPQQFAANLSASTMQAMQAILANGDLTPESKSGAIQNLIDVANSQLAWASTFYNTALPPLSAPGSNVQSTRAVG